MQFNLKSRKFLIFIFAAIILVGTVAGWFLFQKAREGQPAAQFVLRPLKSDAAGLDPSTGFVLQSSQPLSGRVVKQILRFKPTIDFAVKKISHKPVFIAPVFAQETTPGTEVLAPDVFDIQPEQALEGDTVYQITIDDPKYADREYAWAFQVKAPFQVISTHPADKGVRVPVNSTIEITFNRENLIEPQSYFEISPQTDGSFQQFGPNLVFQPKNLTQATVYTATVKKGLGAVDCEDVLAEDYSFKFETTVNETTFKQPSFEFEEHWLEFLPGKNIVLKVWTSNLNPAELKANLYRFSDYQEFMNSYYSAADWQMAWAYYYRRNARNSYQPPSDKLIFSFQPRLVEFNYRQIMELPQQIQRGYYFLRVADSQKVYDSLWFQATPLSHYFAVTHNQGFIWLYDFPVKKPLAGATVSIVSGQSQPGFLGKTNSDGLLSFATPANLQQKNEESFPGPQFFQVDKDGYLPLLVKASDVSAWSSKAGQGDVFWDYLATDKPLYRPSDTLKYWGIIKGRQEDVRGKRVTVGIYNDSYVPNYSAIDESKFLVRQEALVSQFDTVQGELSFQGVAPGYYTLVVGVGSTVAATVSVRILTYTKPAYQITVTPDQDTIYAGQPISFKAAASFFDGTPVAKLKLKYDFYWLGEQKKGEIALNERGEGLFSFTPAYSEDSSYYFWPRSLDIRFSPMFSEEGEIYGDGTTLVFGPNLYLQAFQEKEAGENYKFTAKLNHFDIHQKVQNEWGDWTNEYIAQPALAHPLQAQVVKITYQKFITGQTYDPINKVMIDNYRYEPKEDILETLMGNTDDKGGWSFEMSLPSQKDAAYEIRFSGKDSQGRTFRATAYAYSSYDDWYLLSPLILHLDINGAKYREQFSIGEKIKLQTTFSGSQPASFSRVLFYRYQNNIDRVVITEQGALEESFESSFLPSVAYQAVVLGPEGFVESETVTAVINKKDMALDIAIKTDKEKYRPKDKVTVDIKVQDKQAKPVETALNLAVVDEALFHILSYDARPKILDKLFQDIFVYPLKGRTFYGWQPAGGAEKGGCFGWGTPILMADGSFRPIEKIRPGDSVLSFESIEEQTLTPAVVQAVSRHQVKDSLIINSSLRVTAEHKLFVNTQWQEAGRIKVGDEFLDFNGKREKVISVLKLEEEIPVYNILVGKYHTYFADRVFVHNEEKGGGARSEFLDVVLFESLNTDHKGEARLSFDVPDNITGWRATILAFSPSDFKAGQASQVIPVSLPFFIDATLNEYYLTGDRPVLRLRFFGDGYNPLEPVSLTVQSQSLVLDAKKDVSGSQTEVVLPVLPEGEHQVLISATQGDSSDSLVKKFRVVNSYFRKTQASVYPLSEGLSGIGGNPDGFTQLTFTETGPGKFYSVLENYSFTSGVRLDQVVPMFVAQNILSQYFGASQANESPNLVNYYREDGGISLFTYSDSDLEVSAKMADLAPDLVFKDKLTSYFQASLSDKKADVHRIAKALYGLSALGGKTLNKINLVKKQPELTLEDKLYLGLALAKAGANEDARTIYQLEIRPGLKFQGPEAWFSQEKNQTKQVKNTGLAAVLASLLDIKDDVRALWEYLVSHNPKMDLDTWEEMLLIKSELTGMSQSAERQARFSLQTNQRQVSLDLVKDRFYVISLSAEELPSLRFSNVEGEMEVIASYEKTILPNELTVSPELSLERLYFVRQGSTNVSEFKDGDVVEIRLYPLFQFDSLDGPYQIVDYLPSGLKPVTQLYKRGLWSGSECNNFWYPSWIVDNTVYLEFNKKSFLESKCPSRFLNYYGRVVSGGNFRAQPAVLQSLKDVNFLSISDQTEVWIK